MALRAALLVALAAALISLTPAGGELERAWGLRTLFLLRGSLPQPEDIVIIAMPRDTGRRLSLPRERSDDVCAGLRVDHADPGYRALGDVPERWGRCHYVALLRTLAGLGTAAIVLDVTFRPREDIDPAEDAALAEALARAGNVVIAQNFDIRRQPSGVLADVPAALSPAVAAAAAGSAPMPLPRAGADWVDSFWTFKEAGTPTATLPAVALQAYARDAWPAVLARIRQQNPAAADSLPPDRAALTAGGQLAAHVLHVRAALREPAIPETPEASMAAPDPTATLRPLQALIDLYTGESRRYFNHRGPSGSFRTLHIADVLAARGDTEALRRLDLAGKAVFIGFADREAWERLEKFPTPYGTGPAASSGVELVATAFANLLERNDVIPTPTWLHAAAAAAAAMLSILLPYAGRAGAAFLLGGAVIWLATAVGLFAARAWWLPVFIPLVLVLPAGIAIAFGLRHLDYRRDRANLRRILDQFVPPAVVDDLARNAGQLGQVKETVNVACLITDIANFTRLGDRLPPAELHSLLSEYFQAIFQPIAAHGGLVSDLKGDSMVAVWIDRAGDPTVRARACHAALDVLAAVERFGVTHPDTPLPTRIGANYGEATLGTVGAPPHYAFSIVGDVANTASRLEQLNKELGTRLLVAAPLVAGLGQFLVRELGFFPLRGRRNPTRVLELVARREEASGEAIRLCWRFAEARASLDAGDLAGARAALTAMLRDHPGDGPSRYFLDRLPPATA